MLFKKLTLLYGKSLSDSDVDPTVDPVHVAAPRELTKAFRQEVLDDLTGAKIYLLDAAAAGYVDSFREDLQDHKFGSGALGKVIQLLEETQMPSDLVWVEYDHRLLLRDRYERGHTPDPEFTDPDEFGLRGFLFDNRSRDKLRVRLFRTDGAMRIIDPLFTAEYEKNVGSKTQFSSALMLPNPHMVEFFRTMRVSESDYEEIIDQEQGDITYEMVLGFILFAILSSPETGVVLEEKASLSDKEQKTARKFGRPWMTDVLRSHVTIRIGKAAELHLAEQRQRRAFEAAQAASRASPVEHWVSEHERTYASGKIVTIKAHKRGVKVADEVPTRVMGPRFTDRSA